MCKYFTVIVIAMTLQIGTVLAEEDLDAEVKKGLEAAKLGDHQTAVEIYSKIYNHPVMKHAPDWAAWILVKRGVSYIELGKYLEAIKDLDRSIEIDASKTAAYYHRGAARLQLGDGSDAIADFDQALKLDPKLFIAYLDRAAAYERKNMLSKSVKDYQSAFTLLPDNYYANFCLAVIYHKQGEFRKALSQVELAIRSAPNIADSYILRGQARNAIGLSKSALRDFEKGCKLEFWLQEHNEEIKKSLAAACSDFKGGN